MYVRALAGAEKIRHWFIAFSHLIIKISLSVLKTFEPFAPHNYLVCSTSYLKICRSSHRSWEQRQSAGLLLLNWSWRFFLDKLIRLLVRFSKMYHYFYSQDIGCLKPKRFISHLNYEHQSVIVFFHTNATCCSQKNLVGSGSSHMVSMSTSKWHHCSVSQQLD